MFVFHARRAAAFGVLLLLGASDVLAQGPTRPPAPMLPLRQTAYLKASNAEAYDHFACGGGNQGHSGSSIALSGDGRTLVVGAHNEDGAGNAVDDSGAAYVFVY